jgi:hypothetical protein
MFGFAVTVGVMDDRVQDYLKNELDPPLSEFNGFERKVDDEGFVHYKFPGMSEKKFSDISIFLNGTDGVTLMGVDDQLTERKIMKLSNLIKEFTLGDNEETSIYPPGSSENGFIDIITALQKALQDWQDKYATGYYTSEQNRADEYYSDIKDIVDAYKDQMPVNKAAGEMGNYSQAERTPLSEQKLRKLIRKTIRQ